MVLNRIALISLFIFVFFPNLTPPLTDFILTSNPRIDYREEVNVPRVIVYVTYSTCAVCPHDPLREQFEQYYNELWTALREMGIQLKTIDKEPELDRDLAELYEKLEVPESMRLMYTLVVSIDEKFLFINHVPVRIVTDFLKNYAKDYGKIVVLRDEVRGLYKVMYEEGLIIECKMEQSIDECLLYSHSLAPWPILSLVVVSGLLDGINPCAFATLIFLIALQFAIGFIDSPEKAKRRVLLFGSTYIIAVYLTYLMIGVTLKQVIEKIPYPHLVSKIGVAVLVAAGIINIKDHFWPGRGISLKLSPSRWETARNWMRKATFPATFVVGIMVALFEFPCTGGIYVAILGMLATRTTFLEGFMHLLLYNIAFIFPLIVILLITSNKKLMRFSLTKWQQHQEKHMRLLEGIIYISLGAFLLFSGFV